MRDLTVLYRWTENRADNRRLDKMIALQSQMTRESFYDIIKGLTKNVTSYHAIKRWEILSENVYHILFEEAAK